MRRRRQKNTLLPKMIGLAVIINAILLPILAQMGVFKNIGGQKLTQVELVNLPPPEKRPPQPKKTAKKQAAKPHPPGRKTAGRPSYTRRAPSGPPPVRVVAAGPTPGGTGDSGDGGITGPGTGASPPPVPVVPTPVTTPPPPTPAPPAAVPPPPKPQPPAPAPPAPASVLVDPVLLSKQLPVLPDDITYDDLHGSFFAVFTIHPDGNTDVKMMSSTGNNEADAVALKAARKWTFRPATLGGKPVLSYQRLEVEFYAT